LIFLLLHRIGRWGDQTVQLGQSVLLADELTRPDADRIRRLGKTTGRHG
jgi:superfamily II DNA/RNA helicase